MRISFRLSIATVLASALCSACSNDAPPTESHPDGGDDVGLVDSSAHPDTFVETSPLDTGPHPDGTAVDSSTSDSGTSDTSTSDTGSDTGPSDAPVYPVIPVGYLVVEVVNGTSPATHARAEFVSDRAGGGCHSAYADPGDVCIVTYCPDGAVTHVSSGSVLFESQHTDATKTDVTLTPGTDGVYPPTILTTALWNDTDGFHWVVSGPGTPTVSYPYGGTGLVPLVSTITSPSMATLAGGIDRSADLNVTLDKLSFSGPFVVRIRTAGATDATGNLLACDFHDSSLTKTVPSVALGKLAAGSYTITMSNQVGDDIGPVAVGGSWQIYQYIDTILTDGSGAAAQLTVDLK